MSFMAGATTIALRDVITGGGAKTISHMFAVSSSRHPFPTEIKYLSVEQQDHQSEAQAVNGVDYLGFGMAGRVRGAGPGIGTPRHPEETLRRPGLRGARLVVVAGGVGAIGFGSAPDQIGCCACPISISLLPRPLRRSRF